MAGTSRAKRSSSATYQSIVSYDGTDFHGFQRQAEDQRTVQQVLEDALRQIGWRDDSVKAAGRTDRGVHAEGQVIAFDLKWDHSAEDLTAALNANLPNDVAVRKSKRTFNGFHPRFDALSRSYRYTFFVDPLRDPLRERYAWRLLQEPDPDLIHRAVRVFEGEHDFAAFGRPPEGSLNTVRHVHVSAWHPCEDRYELHIEANAFLYHMVRHIAGAVIDVAVGREDPGRLQVMLDNPTVRREGRLAPAAGLCLIGVKYEWAKARPAPEDD